MLAIKIGAALMSVAICICFVFMLNARLTNINKCNTKKYATENYEVESQAEEQPKTTDFKIIYNNAKTIFSWFRDKGLGYDCTESRVVNGHKYYKVINSKYKDLSSLKYYMNSYLEEEVVQRLLKDKTYIDIDGELYTVGVKSGKSVSFDDTIKVDKYGNNAYLYVTSDFSGITSPQKKMILKKMYGRWVFTSFLYVR